MHLTQENNTLPRPKRNYQLTKILFKTRKLEYGGFTNLGTHNIFHHKYEDKMNVMKCAHRHHRLVKGAQNVLENCPTP